MPLASARVPTARRVLALAAAAAALLFAVVPVDPAASSTTGAVPMTYAPPPIRHVFVINLENEG